MLFADLHAVLVHCKARKERTVSWIDQPTALLVYIDTARP